MIRLFICTLFFACCFSSADSRIKPKPLSHFKVSFTGNYGDYAYDYRIDTKQNTIEEVTDSIDIPMFDYIMRKNALGDSIDQFRASFQHFYSSEYCLQNDSFVFCGESILKKYNRPLIISKTPYSTRLDTNVALSLTEFPAISDYKNLPANHHFRKRGNSHRKNAPDSLLADTTLDLNNDAFKERISLYYSKSGATDVLQIEEKDSAGWHTVERVNVFVLYSDYFRFYTLSFKGKQNRALVINSLAWDPLGWGYFPPLRSWEQIVILMPEN